MKKTIVACLLTFSLGSMAIADDMPSKNIPEPKCNDVATEDQRSLAKENPNADERAILGLEVLLCYALQSNDIDILGQYATDDLLIQVPGAPIMVGKDVFLEMTRDSYTQGMKLFWEPISADVSGDMGWSFGAVVSIAPGQEPKYGKYAAIWKKIEGQWHFSVDMPNFNG